MESYWRTAGEPGACRGEKRTRVEGRSAGPAIVDEMRHQCGGHEEGENNNVSCWRPAKGLRLSSHHGLCSDPKASQGALFPCGSTYGAPTGWNVAARQEGAPEATADVELMCDLEVKGAALGSPAARGASLRMPSAIRPSLEVDASVSAATAGATHHDRNVPMSVPRSVPTTAFRMATEEAPACMHQHQPAAACPACPARPSARSLPLGRLQQCQSQLHCCLPGTNKGRSQGDPWRASGTPSSATVHSLAESAVGGGSGTSTATEGAGAAGPDHISHQIAALQSWVLRAEEQARMEAVRADRLEEAATQLASQLQNSELQFVSAVQLALRLSDRLKQAHALNAMFAQEPGLFDRVDPGGPQGGVFGGKAGAEEEAESFCRGESCGSVQVKGVGAEGGDECLHGHSAKQWGGESANASEDTEKYAVEILAHEDRLCLQCKENVACTVALPCRHLTLCKGCSKSARECPKCLGTVHSVLHIEM